MEKLAELTLNEEHHDSPLHPKNQVAVHNLILDDKLEATKEYTEFETAKGLGLMLNKKMKIVKAFRKPEHDHRDPEIVKKAKELDKIYTNTYRNGFVSALALSFNFHLPLIISPNDIWLTVMQGFKIHMNRNADKEYIKLSFKNLKKLD